MNPNIPMYPMQMGDGYTKYYSQPNHLPYATYNSGPQPYTQLPYSTPSMTAGSRAPSPLSLPPQNVQPSSLGQRYHAPSNKMYPRFPVQDLTGRPLMQPRSGLSPSNVSYTPVSPKTSTGNTVLFMNCSPDVYKRSPTPPGSYRSPGSTPTVFGSSAGTTPHSQLPLLHDEAIFQSYMDSTQGERTSTPPQSVEDKFKAKASQYGIEISSTVEQFLKSQEKDTKHTIVPKVSKSDPTLNHHKKQKGDVLDNFQQKALTNGIIMEDPREKAELSEMSSKERDQVILKCIDEFCGTGKELLDEEERNSLWNRSNSIQSTSSKHSESQEDSFEEETSIEKSCEEDVNSVEIDHQKTENVQLGKNDTMRGKDQTYLEDLAKDLVNDAILGALKDLRVEENERNCTDKATCGSKLYSWPMKMNSNDIQTDKQQTDSNNNGNVPLGVIASKPLLRSVLDPGSPEFMPKEKSSFPLNTGSPEFIPSTGNGVMPCFSFVNSVSDNSWPEGQKDTSFNPAQHIHRLGQSYYSKNASCQTWLEPMVNASCNTPQVKLKDQSMETVTCDLREVGINTMETFECDDDDTIIMPLNELRCRLADTQRELLLLRGKVCLDEMERQISTLEKSRITWTSYFDLDDADLEELIDFQITTLKKKILCHLEKIREFEEKLDSGEILTEVPCFESIVTSNKVSKLVNKKKMNSLQKFSQELSHHSIEKTTTTYSIADNDSVVGLVAENRSVSNSPTDEMMNPNPTKTVSDSQMAKKKKTKDKTKKKGVKSGGKSQVKEGQSKVKDSGEVKAEKRDKHTTEQTQQQATVNNGNLSTPEEVAQFLQHEWELSQKQGVVDDTVLVSSNMDNPTGADNLQCPQRDEKVERKETQTDSVSKSSLKSEVLYSSSHIVNSLDVKSNSVVKQKNDESSADFNCSPYMTNNSTEVLCELNDGNFPPTEQTGVSDVQISSTNLETNEFDMKHLKKIEMQVIDQENVNGVPLGQTKQMSNEEMPPASAVHDMMGSNLEPQVSNSTATQQTLPESGVTVDPILFEAVKAQIAQVYPAFAADPSVLNSIALQQTMVLQACVASGGNLGISGAQPVVGSEKVDTEPKLSLQIPSESSACKQEKDTSSCVQPQPHQQKETTDFSLETSIPTSASGAIPKRVSSYQNSGIMANPLPNRKEFDSQLEQIQDIAPPPGLSGTSIASNSSGSKPFKFDAENKACDPYNMPSVQSVIGASINLDHVNQPDPATLNTQSAYIPPLIPKSFDTNFEHHAPEVSEGFMKSSVDYFGNQNKTEQLLTIGQKSSAFPSNPSLISKREFAQPSIASKEMSNQKQLENSLDSISDKISSINLSAGIVGGSPNVLRKEHFTQKGDSKMESLNLDEIDDDDDEEEEDEKDFAIKSKESQDLFNQWQKPSLTKRENTPPPEETKSNQLGMQKLGSVMHTRRTQLEKGSLRDWMKKDTEVEVGRAVDQLDQISYGSDTQQQLAVQARPQEKPRLIKETTPEEEESWTQVTKKGKKKEVTQPLPPLNPQPSINPPPKLSATSRPSSEKSNNFERLVQRLGEIFAGLSREELISVITSVRKQRGGLSGLTVKDIVADARVFATRLMKNKNKLVTQTFCDFSMPFQKNQERTPPRDDEEICIICHDGLSCEEVKSLECGHVFHAGCIKQWVYGREMTCPTCRRLVLFPEEFPKLGK